MIPKRLFLKPQTMESWGDAFEVVPTLIEKLKALKGV